MGTRRITEKDLFGGGQTGSNVRTTSVGLQGFDSSCYCGSSGICLGRENSELGVFQKKYEKQGEKFLFTFG